MTKQFCHKDFTMLNVLSKMPPCSQSQTIRICPIVYNTERRAKDMNNAWYECDKSPIYTNSTIT